METLFHFIEDFSSIFMATAFLVGRRRCSEIYIQSPKTTNFNEAIVNAMLVHFMRSITFSVHISYRAAAQNPSAT